MSKNFRLFLLGAAVTYLGKKLVKLDKENKDLREANQKMMDQASADHAFEEHKKLEQQMKCKEIFNKYTVLDSLIEKNVSTEDLEFIKGLMGE